MPVRIDEIRQKLIFTAPLRRLTVDRLDQISSFGTVELQVRMCNARLRLHPELDPTELWTYDGEFPGKVIVVRKGQKVGIEWINEITGTLPIDIISCGTVARNMDPNNHPQNEPGKDDGGGPNIPDARGALLPAWTVVHLHGGRTAADSDGWTENAFLSRGVQKTSQRTIYANDQRATLLWYHDHAMSITRLNVYAGLAGAWVIRDEEEEALELPADNYELPLVIQDRNLEVDGDHLTGRLMHKVETDPNKAAANLQTMEFFGPFTLVNGTIWPFCMVKPKPYRLRVLNGSNARTYQLFLIDEQGNIRNDLIRQIGTDGGLLGKPVQLDEVVYTAPPGPKGLVLSPAERADLIVDFQRVPNGKLRWVNVAPAPYDGMPAQDNSGNTIKPGDASDAGRLPFPEVMRFDVSDGPVDAKFELPKTLSSFAPYPIDSQEWKSATHRWLALNETQYVQAMNMPDTLFFNELLPLADDATDANFTLTLAGDTKARKFKNVPVMFSDKITWIADVGKREIWHILNFTSDAHPIHLHLTQFQILRRDIYNYNIQNGPQNQGLTGTTAAYSNGLLGPLPGNPAVPNVFSVSVDQVDQNEKGWKDTVRVYPNGMVTIAVIFDGFTGRYMYHCHILEHEDMDMMRPFIVMPEQAHAFMAMDMSGSGGSSGMGGDDMTADGMKPAAKGGTAGKRKDH